MTASDNPIAADVDGRSSRGPWATVPDAQWNDWRWQQRNRVKTLAGLEALIELTAEEREGIVASRGTFRMAITPYYASLMDPKDPECPIRRQAVPHTDELVEGEHDLLDPLGEESDMPVAGLTHRYPDRVLLYVTHNCPVYCRHCTRKRKVGAPESAAPHQQIEAGLKYIEATPEVHDVLVSGGDPMSLSDDRLVALFERLAAIEHVHWSRLCTRNPVTLPQRFTPELIARLRAHHPIFVHTHFNHPKECTPEAARCLRALADAGFSVANQMVLLAGINDDVEVVRAVNSWLLRQRCRPYYLFQGDLAEGISHFRTPVEVGLKILDGLRGHSSGMLSPKFVIDAPGGGGKVPLVPDYVESREDGALWVRSFNGKLYRYPER